MRYLHENDPAVIQEWIEHEDPGVDETFPVGNVLPEALKEPRLVLIIVEYLRLVDSSHHDMVQGSGYVQSRLTWHEVILLKRV